METPIDLGGQVLPFRRSRIGRYVVYGITLLLAAMIMAADLHVLSALLGLCMCVTLLWLSWYRTLGLGKSGRIRIDSQGAWICRGDQPEQPIVALRRGLVTESLLTAQLTLPQGSVNLMLWSDATDRQSHRRLRQWINQPAKDTSGLNADLK